MADRSVVIRLKADVSEFTAKMRAAGASAKDSLGQGLKDVNKEALNDLGNTAGKIGVVAAAGLGAVTKAAMDWETAWAGVTKTVDGSGAQMAELEDDLRELARTLPATHAEIAGVAEAAGQLGVAREDIATFTATMVDLQETTNLTAEEAATSIAQMANVMGTPGAEIDNLGSALVALGNDGASTERDIIQMAQGISGAAAVVGLAESDVLALANATASMGIEVEAGGSAISRVLVDMGKASKQGGEDLEKFATAAGMSSEEFAAAFTESPAQAFAAFVGGLDDIKAAGGDVFTTLEQLKLSDVRVQRALLGMASAGDLLTDSLELGAQAWDDNTALALEAAKRYETTAAQTQIAWNNIKDAMIEFGDATLPVLAEVAERAAGFAQTLGGLPGPVKTAAAALGGITAVLGGGFWFTAKTINGISNMRNSLENLRGSSEGAAGAMKGLQGAAVGVAAVMAVGSAIKALEASSLDAVPGVESLTASLLELRDAEVAREFAKDLGDIGDALNRVDDPGIRLGALDKLHGMGRQVSGVASAIEYAASKTTDFGTGAATSFAEAETQIAAVDAALANMVNAGAVDAAETALGDLAAVQNLSGDEVDRLVELMPQYREALAGQENAAKLAADGTLEVGDAALEAAEAEETFAEKVRDSVEAMREKKDANLRALGGTIGYEQALDDARKAAEENGKTLDVTTEKGRDNLSALADLAGAWNDLESVQQNARGAYRKAREDLIDAAMRFTDNKKLAKEYADELLETPDRVQTEVVLKGIAKAADDLDEFLRKATDNRISIPVLLDATGLPFFGDGSSGGEGNRDRRGYVAGGAIHGPGTGTSDSIPALLSNGEHVITAAEVQAAGGHGAIYAWRQMIRGYAAGGAVSFASRPAPMPAFANGGAVGGGTGGRGGAPMIGTQYVMPHNYNEFVRQQEANQRAADGGGI